MSDDKLEQMRRRGSIKSVGCGTLYIVDHGDWATVTVHPSDFPDEEALLAAAKQIIYGNNFSRKMPEAYGPAGVGARPGFESI